MYKLTISGFRVNMLSMIAGFLLLTLLHTGTCEVRCPSHCDIWGRYVEGFKCSDDLPYCCGNNTLMFCCRDWRHDISKLYGDQCFCTASNCLYRNWEAIASVITMVVLFVVVMLCCCLNQCNRTKPLCTNRLCLRCCPRVARACLSFPCCCYAGSNESTTTSRESEDLGESVEAGLGVDPVFNPHSEFALQPPDYESVCKDPPKYEELANEGLPREGLAQEGPSIPSYSNEAYSSDTDDNGHYSNGSHSNASHSNKSNKNSLHSNRLSGYQSNVRIRDSVIHNHQLSGNRLTSRHENGTHGNRARIPLDENLNGRTLRSSEILRSSDNLRPSDNVRSWMSCNAVWEEPGEDPPPYALHLSDACVTTLTRAPQSSSDTAQAAAMEAAGGLESPAAVVEVESAAVTVIADDITSLSTCDSIVASLSDQKDSFTQESVAAAAAAAADDPHSAAAVAAAAISSEALNSEHQDTTTRDS